MLPVNRVLQGDCNNLLPLLPNGCVDLIVTDPPYGVSYQDRHGRRIANDTDLSPVLGAFSGLYRVLKTDSLCISFYGWTRVEAFLQAWRAAGFRAVGHIVWVKEYASRARYVRYRHEQAFVLAKGQPPMPARPLDDVQPWIYSGNGAHPTEKAVRILTPLVASFSQPGQLVLDPFCGAGSSLIAAAMLGRRYLGIELEGRYCEIARTRVGRALARQPMAS